MSLNVFCFVLSCAVYLLLFLEKEVYLYGAQHHHDSRRRTGNQLSFLFVNKKERQPRVYFVLFLFRSFVCVVFISIRLDCSRSVSCSFV